MVSVLAKVGLLLLAFFAVWFGFGRYIGPPELFVMVLLLIAGIWLVVKRPWRRAG